MTTPLVADLSYLRTRPSPRNDLKDYDFWRASSRGVLEYSRYPLQRSAAMQERARTSPSLSESATARLDTVEEHVRLENRHDLAGIMATFGSDAAYGDAPWGERHHLSLRAKREAGQRNDLLRSGRCTQSGRSLPRAGRRVWTVDHGSHTSSHAGSRIRPQVVRERSR